MAALSMSPSTTCGVIKDCAVYNNQYCERNSVRCFASPLIGMGNVKGALLTAPKQEYLTAQQEMISVHAELPRTILSDDKWLRLSDVPKESYLFAKHTPATHAELLHLAQLGKFPQFLAKSALLRGSQTQPRYFTNLNEMKAKLNDFISNGTKVGIHTHLGVIDRQDNLINWANPSQPLNELIESFYIGKLDSLTVNSGNANIVLQNGQNSNLTHFLSDGRGEYYLIGNELFKCANVNDPTLEDCRRGMYGTSPSSHDQGESVYIVPLNYLGLPFLKHGSSAFNQSVDGFAQTLSLLNAKMAYIDGTDSYVTMPGFARKSNEDNTMKAKLGLVPYLRKIEELSSQVPLYQTGGITSTFGWWYDNRIATDDGAVYKSKEYTKAKVKTIENSADKFAHYMYRELGWWRFAGSYITNGKFDFDATTADDLHYLMTKAIAFDTSVGMQLDPSYTNHAKLDELFSLIGFYHEFLNKTRSGQITIPSQITDYLQNENAEAELVYVPQLGGYQFINKSVQRIYASWSSSSPAHYTIQNPFGAQNASFVIKARFDYYPYNDPQHLTITDHFDNWFELTNSSSSVSCEWQDNNGHLRISNNGGKPGGCKIRIPLSGRIDLTNKRGLAIKITGDNSGAVGMVRIQKDGFAMRDYKFKIDFSGTRELVLGDAAGENEDYNERGERIDWEGYIAKKRHWSLDFSKINEVYVFINNVQPSQEVNIQLHELKALAEKNNGENKIVNPRITINSRQITFNVNLSTSGADAYMLAYDGNSNSFSLYSANLENLGTFLLDPAQRLELTHGQNDFEISSDLSSPDYSARAEVIFTTDDDEDNDGVPTNGDYLASNNLCNPSTRPALVNFCDDNDNTRYNPSQT
ncbi:hypothetical protein D6817_00320 [Candidatus Pacearchaeota archaeon]|nr:MAG: hypothetical protein D6817_00320 [Candidatus Pacearchaeota archaeon]